MSTNSSKHVVEFTTDDGEILWQAVLPHKTYLFESKLAACELVDCYFAIFFAAAPFCEPMEESLVVSRRDTSPKDTSTGTSTGIDTSTSSSPKGYQYRNKSQSVRGI